MAVCYFNRDYSKKYRCQFEKKDNGILVKIEYDISNEIESIDGVKIFGINTEIDSRDILTFTENKIIGIEHFEFDSSKIGGKGSSYQREIGKITNEFNKVVDSELETKKEIIMHNDIKAENSLNNYYDNFKKYFLNHYKNVDSYIENIKESFNCDNKEVEIWFFAEDTSMLGSYYLNKEILEY